MRSNVNLGQFRSIAVAALLLLSIACGLTAQESADAEAKTESGESVTVEVDREELEAMVGAAVAARIRPLVREIRDLKNETRLHDILGGIGYIIGLAGVAFYFLGVRRRDRARVENKDRE